MAQRYMHPHALLILDNCDDIIHDQKEDFQEAIEKLAKNSKTVKS